MVMTRISSRSQRGTMLPMAKTVCSAPRNQLETGLKPELVFKELEIDQAPACPHWGGCGEGTGRHAANIAHRDSTGLALRSQKI